MSMLTDTKDITQLKAGLKLLNSLIMKYSVRYRSKVENVIGNISSQTNNSGKQFETRKFLSKWWLFKEREREWETGKLFQVQCFYGTCYSSSVALLPVVNLSFFKGFLETKGGSCTFFIRF